MILGYIKHDISKLLDEIASGMTRVNRLNFSQVVLIPKNNAPSSISDYRPIALINSSIKIIFKIVACRLSSVWKDLVSDYPTSFIIG